MYEIGAADHDPSLSSFEPEVHDGPRRRSRRPTSRGSPGRPRRIHRTPENFHATLGGPSSRRGAGSVPPSFPSVGRCAARRGRQATYPNPVTTGVVDTFPDPTTVRGRTGSTTPTAPRTRSSSCTARTASGCCRSCAPRTWSRGTYAGQVFTPGDETGLAQRVPVVGAGHPVRERALPRVLLGAGPRHRGPRDPAPTPTGPWTDRGRGHAEPPAVVRRSPSTRRCSPTPSILTP